MANFSEAQRDLTRDLLAIALAELKLTHKAFSDEIGFSRQTVTAFLGGASTRDSNLISMQNWLKAKGKWRPEAVGEDRPAYYPRTPSAVHATAARLRALADMLESDDFSLATKLSEFDETVVGFYERRKEMKEAFEKAGQGSG